MSTGKALQKAKIANPVTCLTFDETGEYVFVGDKKGIVYTFQFAPTGALKLIGRVIVSPRGSVNCISHRSKLTTQKQVPALLVGCNDNAIYLFR
jgi:hypothetical protein